MTDSRFIELLSKKNAGTIALHEQKELLDFLRANPDYEEVAKKIDTFCKLPVYDEDAGNGMSVKNTWLRTQEKLNRLENNGNVSAKRNDGFRIRSILLRSLTIAASLALILAGYIYFQQKSDAGTLSKANIVSTQKGSKTNLVLPDGSQVWLNADSKISYGRDFGKDSRELHLEGEAYFDVKKDAAHPFVIHTRALDVKVLGTAFNVRAYKDEPQTETTLIRGKVEIFLKNYGDKKVVLSPMEKITVSSVPLPQKENVSKGSNEDVEEFTLSKIKKVVEDSSIAETGWVKNRLVFNKTPLEEIAKEVGRWYDVDIIILNEKLKSKEYSGTFDDKSLQDVLESLKLAGGLNYSINNKTVTIESQ
ncbi:MAG: DUF4974 domain-containing protein [Niabella sp.]